MNSIAFTIPGSKSITNRALLLSALAEGQSVLRNVLFSEDTRAMMRALQTLGMKLSIDEAKKEIAVWGCAGVFPNTVAHIHCQDAGTVARFLLVACANQAGCVDFDGNPRLRERPLGGLLTVLRAQGAEISADSLPLRVTNTHALFGGEIFVSGDVSSQFLSGLLMMATYFQQDTVLMTENLVSRPYVEMTCAMMQAFGVQVHQRERSFDGMLRDQASMPLRSLPSMVRTSLSHAIETSCVSCWCICSAQQYQARDYWIESDFSSASYFFAAAAITGKKIILRDMFVENSLQGDSAFLNVLEKMGCVVEIHDGDIAVMGPKKLRGIEVDMRHMSDVMMTLAAIAPFADSPTRIINVGNTRVKESDRIHVMVENLRQLDVRVDEEISALTIYPSVPKAGLVRSYNDHRIAMAFAVLGLRVPGVIIDDVACVSKTFPGFFEVFKKL